MPHDGEAIAAALLDWFATHQRDLPWRRSRDPYKIWISEVMLQQTRVETVIPYYRRWLERFPTLTDLAEAHEDDVLKAWEGLGYYSRARNLHVAAREVASSYGGEVPDDPEAMSGLKGVGPYTVGAVLSIAFNRPLPAVDGNVLRVLSRLFLITDDVSRPTTRRTMEQIARSLIPPGQAGQFNQALMELGALICTPASPKCLLCPVVRLCRARGEGDPAGLPVKQKAKPPRPVAMVAVVLQEGGRCLIARRPEPGLLGGLWEFPSAEVTDGLTPEQAAHRILGLTIELEAELTRVKHVFSHLVWDLRVFTARPAPGAVLPAETVTLRWVTPGELDRFAFPGALTKVLAALRP